MGRAVVSRADPLTDKPDRGSPGARGDRRAALGRKPTMEIPQGFPGALLHRSGVRAFNALRWSAASRSERRRAVALAPYLFPLDGVGEWNRLYGAAGLIQHQFVVPAGQDEAEVLAIS